MTTALESRLDALQACLVALAATLPPESASLARRLILASIADKGDRRIKEDADAASTAVFSAVLGALPKCD